MSSERILQEISDYEKQYCDERDDFERENESDFVQDENSSCHFPRLGISLWDGLVWLYGNYDDLHEIFIDSGFDNGLDISWLKELINSSDFCFDSIAYL